MMMAAFEGVWQAGQDPDRAGKHKTMPWFLWKRLIIIYPNDEDQVSFEEFGLLP